MYKLPWSTLNYYHFWATVESRFLKRPGETQIVTVKGKTDINGKPFERQKRMDDERLSNGS